MQESVHKQYLKLRLVSETLSSDTIPVLMNSIKMVLNRPSEDIPRHMTLVLHEAWLAYSRIEPERSVVSVFFVFLFIHIPVLLL